MTELIKFDPNQADKLVSNLTGKAKTIQLTLNKIDGLVGRTADQNWDGLTRVEYIDTYRSSSAQISAYLRKWLKEITDLLNRTKADKERQDEAHRAYTAAQALGLLGILAPAAQLAAALAANTHAAQPPYAAQPPQASLEHGNPLPDVTNSGHLLSLGYTPEELREMWSQMTATEREFFSSLDGTKEGYEKAFQTDPKDLSAAMTLALCTYATKLLELDVAGNATSASCRQVEVFTNAMLSSGEEYRSIADDGTVQGNYQEYKDVYLEKLYTGTAMKLTLSTFTLAAMEKDTPEYKKLSDDHTAQLAMTNYWMTQYQVIEEVKRRNSATDISRTILLPEISGLKFPRGEVQFVLMHEGGNRSEHVTTELLKRGEAIREKEDLKVLRSLEAELDAVFYDVLAAIMMGGLTIACGHVSAALAATVSVICMILDGAAGSVSKLNELVDNKAAEIGIQGANLIVSELINGLNAMKEARQAIDDTNYRFKMEWFGWGGYYEASSEGQFNSFDDIRSIGFADIYDPDVVRNMLIWEKEGIKGWANLTNRHAEYILERVGESKGYDSQVYKDCFALMYGGYELFGIGIEQEKVKGKENELKNDMFRFKTAIDAFNDEDFIVIAKWTQLLNEG